uniref:Uncharacterized protein n=1 Tax=Hucho hucho TaxID=62062 RepID=A0A4W5NVS1_9TELE
YAGLTSRFFLPIKTAGTFNVFLRSTYAKLFCTRIIYDRKFLLECRTSTLAPHPKQPPNNLIPPADKSAGKCLVWEDAQFEMDI